MLLAGLAVTAIGTGYRRFGALMRVRCAMLGVLRVILRVSRSVVRLPRPSMRDSSP